VAGTDEFAEPRRKPGKEEGYENVSDPRQSGFEQSDFVLPAEALVTDARRWSCLIEGKRPTTSTRSLCQKANGIGSEAKKKKALRDLLSIHLSFSSRSIGGTQVARPRPGGLTKKKSPRGFGSVPSSLSELVKSRSEENLIDWERRKALCLKTSQIPGHETGAAST